MKILLIAALFWLMSSLSAVANHCDPWDVYVEHLNDNFQETPIALGQVFDGQILTLFVAENGSWTMLMTDSNSISCLILSGQDWQTIPQTDPPIEGRDI